MAVLRGGFSFARKEASVPYALWNLADGKEPSGVLVKGAEDAPPQAETIVDALAPGQVWDAKNRRVRDKTAAEGDAQRRVREGADADLGAAVAALETSRNPETQALLKVLRHRGLA